jgi:hypothetical protein
MVRNDLSRPRKSFRTREEGTLSTRTCETCMGVLYRVEEGSWLHWLTLGTACPREGSETIVEVAFGPTVQECRFSVLDSPERGLARAQLSSTYRRPSWEWMGCR